MSLLLSPVEEYVNEIRRADLVDRAPTMNVSSTDSLLHVLKKVGSLPLPTAFASFFVSHTHCDLSSLALLTATACLFATPTRRRWSKENSKE